MRHLGKLEGNTAMSFPSMPYGSWKSPITSDLIVGQSITLSEVCLDGGKVYWLEGRPQEQGRCVVVWADADGRSTDITPPPYNARTRVHEYGGGSWTVRNGTVYFSNFGDGRLYRQESGASEPLALTPEPPARGYAPRNPTMRRRQRSGLRFWSSATAGRPRLRRARSISAFNIGPVGALRCST
jgi:hypothetical protein